MATEAAVTTNWTRAQTLAALHVYLQLPFGQLHQRNPKLIELAHWIGRDRQHLDGQERGRVCLGRIARRAIGSCRHRGGCAG